MKLNSMYFLTFCEKTSFFKLEDIFPECFINREKSSHLQSMTCLDSVCPENKNCMEMLSKRIYILFNEVLPNAELTILYFKMLGSSRIGGSIFWKNMSEPRNIVINPSAWQRIKAYGIIYEFTPNPVFWMTGIAPPPKIQENPPSVSLD